MALASAAMRQHTHGMGSGQIRTMSRTAIDPDEGMFAISNNTLVEVRLVCFDHIKVPVSYTHLTLPTKA